MAYYNVTIMKGNFQTEWHHLRVNLLQTAGWLRAEVNKILEPYGITQQQFNILRILRGALPEPISTATLRDRLMDKNSDTSRLVDRLIAKELVSKETAANDKRLVDVKITPAGLSLLKKIDTQLGKLDGILQNITEDEAKKLNQLLDKLQPK